MILPRIRERPRVKDQIQIPLLLLHHGRHFPVTVETSCGFFSFSFLPQPSPFGWQHPNSSSWFCWVDPSGPRGPTLGEWSIKATPSCLYSLSTEKQWEPNGFLICDPWWDPAWAHLERTEGVSGVSMCWPCLLVSGLLPVWGVPKGTFLQDADGPLRSMHVPGLTHGCFFSSPGSGPASSSMSQ